MPAFGPAVFLVLAESVDADDVAVRPSYGLFPTSEAKADPKRRT